MQLKVTETYTTSKSDMVYILKIGTYTFRVWAPPVVDGTFWVRLTAPGKNGGTAQAQAASGATAQEQTDALLSSLRMQMAEVPPYVAEFGVKRCVEVAAEFPQPSSEQKENSDASADDSE